MRKSQKQAAYLKSIPPPHKIQTKNVFFIKNKQKTYKYPLTIKRLAQKPKNQYKFQIILKF
jgi:hypothetical protein